MIDRLFRRYPPPAGLLLLLAGYFLLHWLLRVTGPGGLEMDEAEQMVLGQRLQLGYSADPPLYTWLQIIFFRLFGGGLPALALLKEVLLSGTYLCSFFIARHLGLEPYRAAFAALALLLLPELVWESQRDLTHSVLVVTLAAATLWSALALLDGRRGVGQYLLLGGLLGMGILAKWNFALFALALLLALALQAPRLLWRPAFLSTILLAALIVAPFLWWMSDHLGVATATSYKLQAAQGGGYWQDLWRGLRSLGTSLVEFSALFLLALAWAFRPWRSRQPLDQRMPRPPGVRLLMWMLWVSLGLLGLFLLFSGGTVFRSRWLLPLLFYLPLLGMALLSETAWKGANLRRFQRLLLLVLLLVPLGLTARAWLKPSIGDFTKPHFPARALVDAIQEAVALPGLVIAQDTFIAGNLRPWLTGVFVTAPPVDFPLRQIWNGGKVLLLWNGDQSAGPPKQLLAYAEGHLGRLLPVGAPGHLARPYLLAVKHDQVYRLGWQLFERAQPGLPSTLGRPSMGR